MYTLLQQEHVQSCQYITVECRNAGCGERVLLANIEDHLKNECLQRLVNCKDCGKQILFSDLEVSVCSYVLTIYSMH